MHSGSLTDVSLIRWIKVVLGVAFSVLLSVWLVYAATFATRGVSPDPGVWGEFGDFVGGTANPVLTFLTLVVLALTIIVQSRQLAVSTQQLEHSTRELELTREELRRSAHAQEQSEKALRAQADIAQRSARLSATNLLLEHYRAEMRSMRGEPMIATDPRLRRMKELEKREASLTRVLDQLYEDIREDKT